ncbi:hypothetical protein N665_1067s0001 [Sinapis alba]|nr:hypothetical protein N665_1067s0001 [Sinapis alba]
MVTPLKDIATDEIEEHRVLMAGESDACGPDVNLPCRLFARDRFPKQRLNIYSKPDTLCFLRHVLKGTQEFKVIRQSCFRGLFDLHARQTPISCKLVHSLLTRQLVCDQKYTLWPVVGGNPFRFSIAEFQEVTELPCGPIPDDFEPPVFNLRNPAKDPYWKELIGDDSLTTVADLGDMIKNDPTMDYDRRLRLALIMIVDGVLIAHKQTPRPTLRYVQMVQDVEAFLQFSWGRECFLKTISCMKPPVEENNPVGTLTENLRQTTYRLQGFPLALQLVAFRAIPFLLTKIPAPANSLTLMEREYDHLPTHPSINLNEFLLAEADPDLRVIPFIPLSRTPPTWNDEVSNSNITYLERLLSQGHSFKATDWPGGDASEPVLQTTFSKVNPTNRRWVPTKKKITKEASKSRTQRRLSSYFIRSTLPSPPTNQELADQVQCLSSKVDVLESLTQALKQKLSRKKVRLPTKSRQKYKFHNESLFDTRSYSPEPLPSRRMVTPLKDIATDEIEEHRVLMAGESDACGPDVNLPRRLLARDRFPRRRLNIYSKPDTLCFLRHVLKGTQEFKVTRQSCFRDLFDRHARQTPISCKLVHSLLTRQLFCNQKYTLWPVVGANPFRFSNAEFQEVTGFPCGPIPDDFEPPVFNLRNPAKDPYWKELIGDDSLTTVADLGDMIKNDPTIDYDRRLRLALIMIVDGVLIAHKQTPRPTLRYVQMVQDVEAFLQFPWGRECFLKTISCMKPPVEENNLVGTLTENLRQTTYRLQGFPLALQLVAFRAIPFLLTKIPAPANSLTLMEREYGHLPTHSSINLNDFLLAEADPDRLLSQGHSFKATDWPGGDASEPVLQTTFSKVNPTNRRRVPTKKKITKEASKSRTQRRLSSYFTRSTLPSPPTNQELADQVQRLSSKVDVLESLTQALKQKLSRKKVRLPTKSPQKYKFHNESLFDTRSYSPEPLPSRRMVTPLKDIATDEIEEHIVLMAGESDACGPDVNLPRRLLARDRFPRRRLNIYSKPDTLCFLRHVLKGTQEFKVTRQSCFRDLFDRHARQTLISCKLVHSLLTRQLFCNQKYTLWPVVGANPFRFSNAEFQEVTGFPCGPIPDDFEPPVFNLRNLAKDPYWKELIGDDSLTTVADLGDMIKNDPTIDYDRRLRLALIMIVDGVLIAHKQTPRPTLRYVQMVQDVEAFLQFPWGRECFLKTISCMKPPVEENNLVGTLTENLRQTTYRLQGFPLALQLVAFRAIPFLLTRIPAPANSLTLMEREYGHLPTHSSINLNDFLLAEADPDRLLSQGHSFKATDWPGGDASEPVLQTTFSKVNPTNRRRVPTKKKITKEASKSRTQRRLSSYFTRSTLPSPPTNQELADQVQRLSSKVDVLESLTQALKQKLSRKKVSLPTKSPQKYKFHNESLFDTHVLKGTQEFKVIRQSCFRGLFDLHARQTPISCKLIHSLLTRQLVCDQKYTLWPVVGGNPFRFSIAEFQEVTRFPCGTIPDDFEPPVFNLRKPAKDPYWKELIGDDSLTTVADLGDMIKNDPTMDYDRRLRLALNHDRCRYVQMVQDVEAFLQFPWGRECFQKTISCMKPPVEENNPVGTLTENLRQTTYRLQGFPLALQLVAFRAISFLLTKIPAPANSLTLMEREYDHFPTHPSINLNDFLLAEADPDLCVIPLIPLSRTPPTWNDEVSNSNISCLERLLTQGHSFKAIDWPGGDASEPVLQTTFSKVNPTNRRRVPTKKKITKEVSKSRTQRRLSSYFTRSTLPSPPTNQELADQVQRLSSKVDVLESLTQALKQKLSRKKKPRQSKFSKLPRRFCLPTKSRQETASPPKSDINIPTPPPESTTQPTCYSHQTPPQSPFPPNEATNNADTIINSVVAALNHSASPSNTPYTTTELVDHKFSHILDPIHTNPSTPAHTNLSTSIHTNPSTPEHDQSDHTSLFIGTKPTRVTDISTREDLTIMKTIGFTAHAESPRGFREIATSATHDNTGFPAQGAEVVSLSDTSTPTKKPRHTVTEPEAILTTALLNNLLIPTTQAIAPLDTHLWSLFTKTLAASSTILELKEMTAGFTVDYLLQLATPMRCIDSTISDKHKPMLTTEKSIFVSPWLTSYIQKKQRSWNSTKDKRRFRWDTNLSNLVLLPGQEWVTNIHIVYAPMIWGDRHWAGLAINLPLSLVEVVDPLPSLFCNRKVHRFLKPVLDMLPYIINRLAAPSLSQFSGNDPFTWERVPDLYENRRCGDCGPVSVKFMEMHALGDPAPHMSGLTNAMVDDFRKQFALELYKYIIQQPPSPTLSSASESS